MGNPLYRKQQSLRKTQYDTRSSQRPVLQSLADTLVSCTALPPQAYVDYHGGNAGGEGMRAGCGRIRHGAGSAYGQARRTDYGVDTLGRDQRSHQQVYGHFMECLFLFAT